MKTKNVNLWILLCITGILLISGCISEKHEEWQPVQEQQETVKEQVVPKTSQNASDEAVSKEPAVEVNETDAKTEKMPSGVNESGNDVKSMPSSVANEPPPIKNENYSGNSSGSDWCVPTGGMKGAAGTVAWVVGVVEFKGKQMCQSRYTSTDVNGTIKYDVYSTKSGDEVYRLITYPNGTVEESRIGSNDTNKTQPFIKKAKKDPAKMVLGLNDLPVGYNIMPDKTGALTREEHIYLPEKLIEAGWIGGYKTAFENEKLYMFNMSLYYKQYLKAGVIDENLMNAFEDNKIYLQSSTVISQVNDKSWKTYTQSWVKQGRMEYYIIEETKDSLIVSERSVSNFLTNRLILNIVSVYDSNKINEVFKDAKQVMSKSAFEVSKTNIGDESMLYKQEITQEGVNYTIYALIFRKLNVYEEIQMGGLTEGMDKNEIIEIGGLIEKKIE